MLELGVAGVFTILLILCGVCSWWYPETGRGETEDMAARQTVDSAGYEACREQS